MSDGPVQEDSGEPSVFRGFRPEGRGTEGNCRICGWPVGESGSALCSYPHGMVPDREVSPGMWTWKHPGAESGL